MEIRPVETPDDHAVALALNNELFPDKAVALEDVLEVASLFPNLHVVTFDGDRPVGTASASVEPSPPAPVLRNMVRPEYRRRGLGTRQYEAISAWAREQGHEALLAYISESETDGVSFAVNRGFEEIGREVRVVLDLAGVERPEIDPPEGVHVVTWVERPDAVQGMYEVACEAYADVPGQEDEQMESFEDWLRHDMSGTGDKPEWTFVALAGDEVVGYSKFSMTSAQPTTGFHDMTGVKRAWRGRGIAGALKRAQIAWAIDNGYERLITNNEVRNAPIRRLNDRMGYRPMPARVLFRGPVIGART